MAQARASAVIEAPVEAVWAAVRDFGRLGDWLPGVENVTIEENRASDVVGCVRAFTIGGQAVRERLTMLDDTRYAFSYNFETPAFPVRDYHAVMRLLPVTQGERTFAEWRATFVEAPEDAGRYEQIIARDVFAAGLASLGEKVRGAVAPAGARRWLDARPAKLFVSAVVPAPLEAVWARVRDFDAFGTWHTVVEAMSMRDGARGDQVSGVRRFEVRSDEIEEQLTRMCDVTHRFGYRMTKGPMPWLNYHAGVELLPVTAQGSTLAVWTADWVASVNDDLALMPGIGEGVFAHALATLAEQFRQAGEKA